MFAQPSTLAEAVALLTGRNALIVAGGTDIYPAHAGRQIRNDVVALSRVAELRCIKDCGGHVRIGGAATWSDIIRAPLPDCCEALKQAAREVGSIQIQNRGTIAGNLCNASPAADGVPPLLALDAEVELVSEKGARTIPLASFITGYRQTALAKGEILTAVIVPKSPGRSAFAKLGSRRFLVISIIMAAAVIETTPGGAIANARVAIGSAGPVAIRLPGMEEALRGLPRGARPSSRLEDRHFNPLSPIDDVRAPAAYRIEAARTIVGEVLDRAFGVHDT